jgi:ABC-2 type transport system ATP-binding protein
MHREDARKKADELVDFVGLGGKSDVNKPVSEFSKGMRQRVGIAQSLINDPTLLFYDEPTSGLDAIARRDIRDLMLELKRQGKTMFLSSHQLEDVELVCHRASIIHKGKLQVLGTMDELLGGERVEVKLENAPAELAAKLTADGAIRTGDVLTASVLREDVGSVIDAARVGNSNVVSVVPMKRRLEDIFVEIVGGRLDKVSGSLISTGDRPLINNDATTANPYKEIAK